MPPRIDFLVLTALALEYKAVTEHLEGLRSLTHPQGTEYEFGSVTVQGKAAQIALAECGQGNVGAAIEAERAISFLKPSYAIFVGVAGGIKDVRIGDVVIATKIYQYESGKAAETFLTRPQVFQSAYRLTQAARAVARNGVWKSRIKESISELAAEALIGPIAAGEKVVASVSAPEFRFIRSHYNDAIAIEMEGLGFLQAGFSNALPCIVIRGISDLIEGKSEADASGSQPRAMAAAAAFAIELACRIFEGTSQTRSASSFQTLEKEAVYLYPYGPQTAEIWSRAGGDLSALPMSGNGKGAWHSALRLLSQGGGGTAISFDSLLNQMIEDFPNNQDLKDLIGQ
jgi:adenosylhomocysteine nucleosidase